MTVRFFIATRRHLQLMVVAAIALCSSAYASDLLDVRFGPQGTDTRVVFDIDGDVSFAISGDTQGQGRIFVDFSDLNVAAANRKFRAGKGAVARYGFASNSDGSARAVLELKTTAKIKEAFMIAPAGNITKHRLVIDLQQSDKTAFLNSLPQKYADIAEVIKKATTGEAASNEVVAAKKPEPKPKIAPAPAADKITVVIDPGHGGADPGAQGQSGTFEKAVTLAAAKELARILKKRGHYEVVLTRNNDSKIKPDEREALARKAGADLFISLHADAIAQKAVRGASVYTLSDQGSERSVKVAKEEGNYVVYNLDTAEFGEGVGDILFDLAQGATNTASSKLAGILIENLTGKTPMLNRSHRTGDLRVLLATDVPAVLLEMAFISNARDEANLNSPVWRKRSMTAVANAIDEYFKETGGLERQAAAGASGAR